MMSITQRNPLILQMMHIESLLLQYYWRALVLVLIEDHVQFPFLHPLFLAARASYVHLAPLNHIAIDLT
jgi:hypothetical protein